MRTKLMWGIAMLSFLFIGGCSVFPKPESFDQKLAYGYGIQTAVLNAAAGLVETGQLSPDEGQRILELADRSRALLDAALAVHRLGDVGEAERQLQLAVVLLTELQRYLRQGEASGFTRLNPDPTHSRAEK